MEFNYEWQPGLTRMERGLVTDGKPEVTIVTPFYNGAKTFEQTFNCVVNQTFPWFEWIIVNDGSTRKEDVAFAEQLAATDPRVRVVHKENGGISTARNYGMRFSTTEYAVFLDCDDLLEPTFLEYCWWMLEKNPKAAWAYTSSLGFQGQEYLWKVPFDPIRLKTENHLTITSMIRKKWYNDVNGFDEKYKHYNEDWYFWLRVVARGGYPAQSSGDDYLFWYRRTDTGVLSIVENKNNEWAKKNAELIEDAAKDVINPHEPVIYPCNEADYKEPVMTKWNRGVFREHKKIHVTLLAPWLEMGGADKFNLDLIAGLDKEQYEVSILTTVPSTEPWGQLFRHKTPEVFNLPNFVEPSDYAEFVSYFLKSRQTDILLVTNSYHGYYMIPWLRANFPKLVIVDYVHMEEWYWRNGGYARTSAAMSAILEKTYVCNSGTRDVMLKKFRCAPENVETLYIGTDEKLFSANRVRSGITYDVLDINPKRPIVLFICRLHPQKRPFLMLEIAKRVKKKVPDVAFVVVGDGPLENDMKNLVRTKDLEDTVIFAGASKEPRPYYKDARVTLICSLKEGLSLTAYESLSMGVPVVSADVGGQADLIDDTVGALIPCEQEEASDIHKNNYARSEVEAYTEALTRILTNADVHDKMAKNCREKITNGFTIHQMVERFDSEFRMLLADPVRAQKREGMSAMLSGLGRLPGDIFTMEMQMQRAESGYNPYAYTATSAYVAGNGGAMMPMINDINARLNNHEIVLNRHEEVVNRHEEVVNRHEQVVNDDWAWLP